MAQKLLLWVSRTGLQEPFVICPCHFQLHVDLAALHLQLGDIACDLHLPPIVVPLGDDQGAARSQVSRSYSCKGYLLPKIPGRYPASRGWPPDSSDAHPCCWPVQGVGLGLGPRFRFRWHPYHPRRPLPVALELLQFFPLSLLF